MRGSIRDVLHCFLFFSPFYGIFQVFYVPNDRDEEHLDVLGGSINDAMPWKWRSNSFALLFTHPIVHLSRREPKIKLEELESKLVEIGFNLHPTVFRQVLHQGGWNCCDSGLLATSIENPYIQEMASVDVVVGAIKSASRQLSSVRSESSLDVTSSEKYDYCFDFV